MTSTYEQLLNARRRVFKQRRGLYDPEARALNERLFEELNRRQEEYLQGVLAKLPFRWHVAHAYTPRETATYGGADHIVLDENVKIGRLSRRAGDALSRRREKFWGLYRVEDDRLPTSLTDIKVAERVVAGSSSSKQLDREIAETLGSPLR
jgi:hypothetical protein